MNCSRASGNSSVAEGKRVSCSLWLEGTVTVRRGDLTWVLGECREVSLKCLSRVRLLFWGVLIVPGRIR